MALKCPILAPVRLDVHKSIVHKTITKGCGAVITLVENSFMQEVVKGMCPSQQFKKYLAQ